MQALSDERANILYDEPFEQIKQRFSENVNRARWTGVWSEIRNAETLSGYDNVPLYLQERFNKVFASLEKYPSYRYQRFDAALAALRKVSMLTHNMGLGKTRISLMAAMAINKPTLIIALPRLIKTVWVKEMSMLGINDFVILERPKRSKTVCISKDSKTKIDKLKGLKGLGKLSLAPVSRDKGHTADASHPAQFKIVSYNMLLPGSETLDYVGCPKCGLKHNQEKCPKISIGFYKYIELDAADQRFIDSLAAQFRKGKIKRQGLKDKIKERFGDIDFRITTCNTPMKGARCPVCSSMLGKHNKPGFFCHSCGYSARTWVPPITRRLKKNIRVSILDESQAIKNRQSLRSRYATSIRPEYRYLTSGTPATSNVAPDLYQQLVWLIGKGVMFPYTSMKNFGDDVGYDGQGNIPKLYSLLDPFQIRRDTDEFGVTADVELPPVNERRVSISLSDEEMENYRNAEDDIRSWLESVRGATAELDLFSKMWILRRAACVPWVDNPEIKTSTKMEALKVEVDNYLSQGRKILIGTEMLDALDAIVARTECARIDGSTPIKTADRIISLFQDVCPECNISLVEEFGELVCPLCEKKYETPKVLAVSRNAVREGVTLNKASVVIFTDPSWTYAEMWQFWKRTHRIGAEYERLEVLYMESPSTIEEQMYDAADRRKAAIMQAINRKQTAPSEKINIRNFVSELLGVTITENIKRRL